MFRGAMRRKAAYMHGLICGTWRLERLAEPDEKPPLVTSPHLHLGSAHHAMPGRARFPPVSPYDASPRPQFTAGQTWTMRRSRTNFLPRSCCCSWSTSSHRPGSHGEGEGGEKRRKRRKGRRAGADGRAPTRTPSQQNRFHMGATSGQNRSGMD